MNNSKTNRFGEVKYKIINKNTGEVVMYNDIPMTFITKVAMLEFFIKLKKTDVDDELEWEGI